MVVETKEEMTLPTTVDVNKPKPQKAKRKHGWYCIGFTALGATLMLLALLVPILWYRPPKVAMSTPDKITLTADPLESTIAGNLTLSNRNFYPVTFKNGHIQLYNDKGQPVGKVNLPDNIKLGSRQGTVIYYNAVLHPTVAEATALARSCRNGNGRIKLRVDASVDQVVAAVTTKKDLAKGEIMVKCEAKSDILSQISKLGKTGQKSGKSYGNIINDIANHIGGKKPADPDAPKAEPKPGAGADTAAAPAVAAPVAAAAPAVAAAAPAAVAAVPDQVQQGVNQVVDQVQDGVQALQKKKPLAAVAKKVPVAADGN